MKHPIVLLTILFLFFTCPQVVNSQDVSSKYASLTTAHNWLDSRNPDSARAFLEGADFSILNPYAQWMLAQSYFQLNQYNKSYSTLRRLLKEHPSFPLWSYVYGFSGRCLYERKEHERAVQRLKRFINKYPQHPTAPEGRLDLARSLAALEQYDEARVEYIDVLLLYPKIKQYDTAFNEYINLSTSQNINPYDIGPSQLLGWARVDLTNRRQGHLTTLAEEYWKVTSPENISDNAEMKWLQARALESLNRLSEAQEIYQQISNEYPKTMWSDQAGVALVAMESRRGNFVQAREYLDDFKDSHRDEICYYKAQLVLGKELYQSGEYKQARNILKKLLKHDEVSSHRYDAMWFLGWSYWKLKRYRGSAHWWTELLKEGENSGYLTAAHYWQARALIKIKKHEVAEEQLGHLAASYPHNYYGILARSELIDQSIDVPMYSQSPMEIEADWIPLPDLADTSLNAKRYRLLIQLGLLDFAMAEGDSLAGSGEYPDWDYHRALLGWQTGLGYPDHGKARQLLENSKLPPDSVAQILYPLVYPDLIGSAGARWAVGTGWILSLIRQESAFDVDAISNQGAIGLLQILPSTAEWMGTKYQIPDWSQLSNPRVNIRIGTAFLSWLTERFDGEVLPAIAAYNAGHKNVERWWVSSDDDLAEWVEDIPYTETRLFVKRVLTNAWTYAQLYPGRIDFEFSTEEIPLDMPDTPENE